MGTTGRFGGGGHGLTGPKHIWYDTDYSELYKGLAVVIGFFLFLVLLLLVFILISYLRKWYRLKKRPTPSATIAAPTTVSSVKASTQLAPSDDCKLMKKYSKVGLPVSSQPQTPLLKSMPKSSVLAPTNVEIVDPTMAIKSHHHSQLHHHPHQMYQEFPPHHYPPVSFVHHQSNILPPHPNMKPHDSSSSVVDGRVGRSSLSTIALT